MFFKLIEKWASDAFSNKLNQVHSCYLNVKMRVSGVSSLIVISWCKFLDSLDICKSYSPGLYVYNMLGLQASTLMHSSFSFLFKFYYEYFNPSTLLPVMHLCTIAVKRYTTKLTYIFVLQLFAQLLHDQVGVVVFEPYKPLFMLSFGRGRTALPAMPGGPPLIGHPHRNW